MTKSLALSLTLSLFCISLYGQKGSPAERLQTAMDKSVAEQKFVGGVAGISVGDKQVLAVAGFRDQETEAPFEILTLNRTASIAKCMTAVAALQLMEQGKLELDTPIAQYLPNYPAEYANRITTRHLLQHSSGIAGYASGKETETKIEYASLTAAATVFQDRELLDEPGNAEYYSTYGYVVLGMVIEAASGQSYEDYMTEHIWAVAGMENTGVEHLYETYENKSSLYYRNKRGKLKESGTNNLSNRVPGGGFYSTVEDLLKFGQAVIRHELISEETFAMMMEKPGLAYEGNPYGMGWFIYGKNIKYGLGEVYGHGGEQSGCSAQLMIFPEADGVVVVMSNTALAASHVTGLSIGMFELVQQMREEK